MEVVIAGRTMSKLEECAAAVVAQVAALRGVAATFCQWLATLPVFCCVRAALLVYGRAPLTDMQLAWGPVLGQYPGAKLVPMVVDCSSCASVRAFVATFQVCTPLPKFKRSASSCANTFALPYATAGSHFPR